MQFIKDVSTALEKKRQLTGGIYVKEITMFSKNASTLYIFFLDSASEPADATVHPSIPLAVNTNGTNQYDFGDENDGRGRYFANGLYVCGSTTAATKTKVGADDCLFEILYNK